MSNSQRYQWTGSRGRLDIDPMGASSLASQRDAGAHRSSSSSSYRQKEFTVTSTSALPRASAAASSATTRKNVANALSATRDQASMVESDAYTNDRLTRRVDEVKATQERLARAIDKENSKGSSRQGLSRLDSTGDAGGARVQEATIRQLRDQLASSKKEADTFRTSVLDWRKERDQMERKLGAMESQLETERRARKTVEDTYMSSVAARTSEWGGPASVKFAKRRHLEQENAELKQTLQEKHMRLGDLEASRREALDRARETEMAAVANLAQVSRERDDLEREATRLNARVQASNDEVRGFVRAGEEMRHALACAQERAEETTVQLNEEQDKRAMAEGEVCRLRDALDTMRRKYTETRTVKDETEGSVTRLRERVRVLEASEKCNEQQLELERKLCEDVKRRCELLEEEVKGTRTELSETRRRLETTSSTLEQCEDELSSVREAAQRHGESAKASLAQTSDELRDALEALRREQKAHQSDLEKSAREVDELQERVRLAQDEGEHLRRLMADGASKADDTAAMLREECARIGELRKSAEDRCAAAERRIVQLQQLNMEVEERLSHTDGERAGAVEHAKRQQTEMETLREQMQRRSDAATQQESEVRRLRNKNAEMARQYAVEREELIDEHRRDLRRLGEDRERLVAEHRAAIERLIAEAAAEKHRLLDGRMRAEDGARLQQEMHEQQRALEARLAEQTAQADEERRQLADTLHERAEAMEREWQSKVALLENENDNLAAMLEEKDAELQHLAQEAAHYEKLANDGDMYRERALEYRKRELSLAAELTETVAAMDEQADERRQGSAEEKELREEMTQIKARLADADNLVRKAEQDANELRVKLQRSTEERDELEDTIAQLRRTAMANAADAITRERFAALVASLQTCVGLVERQTQSARKHMRFSASMNLTPRSTAAHSREDHEALVEAVASVRRILGAATSQQEQADALGASMSASTAPSSAGAAAEPQWRSEYAFCQPILKVVERSRLETAQFLETHRETEGAGGNELTTAMRAKVLELDQHMGLLMQLITRVVGFATAQGTSIKNAANAIVSATPLSPRTPRTRAH